jgi:hypothetical protein
MPRPPKRIDLPEAVKRADKALKRETGTPPKPYRPAREKTAPSPSQPRILGGVTQAKRSGGRPGRSSRKIARRSRGS